MLRAVQAIVECIYSTYLCQIAIEKFIFVIDEYSLQVEVSFFRWLFFLFEVRTNLFYFLKSFSLGCFHLKYQCGHMAYIQSEDRKGNICCTF